MVGNESTGNSAHPIRYPDRLQQILNRLHKQYEDMSYEDRHQQMVEDIRRMEMTENERQELLRRLD